MFILNGTGWCCWVSLSARWSLLNHAALRRRFQANIDYVEAPLDQLPDRIEYYLGSKTGQQEAQAIIEQGYQTLTRQCRLSDMLRPLVERLISPATGHVGSATRFFPTAVGAVAAQARSICVVTPDVTGEGPYADARFRPGCLGGGPRAGRPKGHALAYRTVVWRNHLAEPLAETFCGQGIEYVALPADAQVPLEGSEACMRAYETWLWLRRQSFEVVHLPDTNGVGFYSLLARKQGSEFQNTLFCLNAHAPRLWRRLGSQQFITNPNELELDFLEQEVSAWPTRWSHPPGSCSNGWNNKTCLCRRSVMVRPDPIPVRSEVAATPLDVRELVCTSARSPAVPAWHCFAMPWISWGRKGLRKPPLPLLTIPAPRADKRPRVTCRNVPLNGPFTWQVANTSSKSTLQYLQGRGRLGILPSPMENSPLNPAQYPRVGLPFLAVQGGGLSELINPADHPGSLARAGHRHSPPLCKKPSRMALSPRGPAANAEQIKSGLIGTRDWLAQQSTSTPDNASPASVPTPARQRLLVHFNRPEIAHPIARVASGTGLSQFRIVLVDDGSTRPEAEAFPRQSRTRIQTAQLADRPPEK